jgi:tRNA(Arg) A34 adenosine deaminase TadA/ADP-ribose pyrophosphatase YjhB (NUDIX family)
VGRLGVNEATGATWRTSSRASSSRFARGNPFALAQRGAANVWPEFPVTTVGALIERADGKILLVRTREWGNAQGGVPGGKVAYGERLEVALRREVKKQTGLEICDVRFMLAQEAVLSPAFHCPAHLILLNYQCRVDETGVVPNDGAEALLWATPSEAIGLALSAPTRELIEHWLSERAPQMSPAPAGRLSAANADYLMRAALDEARLGLAEGECPIGCVVGLLDGNAVSIIARGHNRVNALGRRTAHAELITFENAGSALPVDSPDIVLISTLEPCIMCEAACMEAGVSEIAFGLRAPADCGSGRVKPPNSPQTRTPRITGGVLAAESRALFERYVHDREGVPEAAYAEQLLSLTRAPDALANSDRLRDICRAPRAGEPDVERST